VATDADTYSASVDERATVDCSLDGQEIEVFGRVEVLEEVFDSLACC
jgi:hypothetical protein